VATNNKEVKIVETKVLVPKCPDCGNANLGLPPNIEKRKGKIFIKGTNLKICIAPRYWCDKCKRKIGMDEIFDQGR